MIKVLHFFKTYHPDSMGGVEQVIFQLVEGTRAHGVEGQVHYLSPRGSARNEPVAQHLTHRSKLDLHVASTGFSLSALKDFAELAREADIIHYHFPWPYMDLVHFLTRVKKPTVVSYHADIVKQKWLLKLYRPLMMRFLRSVDRIVVSSPNYAAHSPVLQQFKDSVRIIPFGLDRSTYPALSAEKLAHWQARLGPRFFLFVGALRYYKGLDFLLEAARTTGLPVAIVGGGFQEAELKARAEAWGLHNVHFLGWLDDQDKTALLQLCEAFVFPSHLRSEAFGVSLLEAAMFAKPMIACEMGSGTTFVNLAEQTGIVVPPRDASALAQAMQRLWDDPAMARAMGQKALERFETVFTADGMSRQYAELYRELLSPQ